MNVSSSAIADAIVTMLSAASVMGSGAVSKSDYRFLESNASAAVMVKWRELFSNISNFGMSSYSDTWVFELSCYIRDTGDAALATNRVWTITDKILTCLKSDGTLQGTVDSIKRIKGNYNSEQLQTTGGMTWIPLNIYIEAIGL